MGIVFQDFRLIDKMTVYDNVAFAMHIVGASDREIRKRVPYVLGLVGLEKKWTIIRGAFRRRTAACRPGPGAGKQLPT